jgi:hypothetical protein
MAHKTGHEGRMHTAVHAVAWLDDKLVPLLGSAPLGPYDEEPAHLSTCPLCGAAMAQHRTERDGEHTYLHCPGDTVTIVVETGRRTV